MEQENENARPVRDAGSEVVVLDSGEVARHVASLLGCGLRSTVPVPGERPVLVVVAEPAEVDALAEVEDWSWVGAVVAWMLPESTVVRLHEFGLVVFVGLPILEEVVRLMDYPLDTGQTSTAQSLAERLAVVESLLET